MLVNGIKLHEINDIIKASLKEVEWRKFNQIMARTFLSRTSSWKGFHIFPGRVVQTRRSWAPWISAMPPIWSSITQSSLLHLLSSHFYHFNLRCGARICCVGGDRTAIGWNENLSTNERAAGKLLKEEFSWCLCKYFLGFPRVFSCCMQIKNHFCND